MTTVAKKPQAPDPAYLAAVLRRRQAMRAQLDEAEALFAVADTEAAALLAQQYEATRSTKSDITLPDDETKFAAVTRVPGSAAAQVEDRGAFVAWVRDTYPDHFDYRIIPARTETFVTEEFEAAVLDALTAANSTEYADPDTGLVHQVPGVRMRANRRPYFRWSFTRKSKGQPLTGQELALDAIEAARLDIRTAPELPAAEVEVPVEVIEQ
ncbi:MULTISPECIES: hypothetical protein [unclassified Streptomyces]|uniref:hypothetical protein n=1 Tax=unclassified Streptomyces TaxID=2593676 RepID=UPI00037979EC|nr:MULTISPECIES: hypothetical protein [unclassified Streptomyces]MYX36755.1 hypothetical protein [Streptomyces sp. SID8377]